MRIATSKSSAVRARISLMGGAYRPRGRTILPMLLCLSWTAACSRPAGVRSAEDSSQHSAPFREAEEAVAHAETSTAQEDGSASGVGIPFRDAQNLPIGTLLTVRLQNPISSDPRADNRTFLALVDEPIVIEG